MKPQVPADISTLSIAELGDLIEAIRVYAIDTLGNADAPAEDKAEARELARTTSPALKARKAELEAEAAQALADDELRQALESDAPAQTDDEDGDAEPDGDEEASAKVPALAGAAAGGATTRPRSPAPTVPEGFGGTGNPESKPAERMPLDFLKATRGVDGKNPGESFESWLELATAAVAKSETIDPATTDRYKLAQIKASYPKERRLGEDMFVNLQKFENAAELTAAFCAPATPYYNLACMNTVRRPVFNSLPGFQAPRMRVTVMSSPSLSDIDSGFGQWTDEDDDDPQATKDCIEIECGTPSTYKMYGVWRCMTVKNLMAMSYPELVEAWLNRLHAAHSRLAETLLLDAMGSGATELAAEKLGYGASVTITSTIMQYLALYQETQRWDIAGNMEAWAHRYILWGMKMDVMRRRRTDGQISVPSDEQINAMFREVGINIHWVIDTPTWGTPIPAVGSSTLNRLPQSVQILIAPPGKFALMDRGELSIGVTGNNIYRDTSSNERNQFTFFFENFEGVVDTNSCPAHILDIPVCWNGVQVDDQLVNCFGADQPDYQS